MLLTGHNRKMYGAPALQVPLAPALTPKPKKKKVKFSPQESIELTFLCRFAQFMQRDIATDTQRLNLRAPFQKIYNETVFQKK